MRQITVSGPHWVMPRGLLQPKGRTARQAWHALAGLALLAAVIVTGSLVYPMARPETSRAPAARGSGRS